MTSSLKSASVSFGNKATFGWIRRMNMYTAKQLSRMSCQQIIEAACQKLNGCSEGLYILQRVGYREILKNPTYWSYFNWLVGRLDDHERFIPPILSKKDAARYFGVRESEVTDDDRRACSPSLFWDSMKKRNYYYPIDVIVDACKRELMDLDESEY
jgi:hypothetical protein